MLTLIALLFIVTNMLLLVVTMETKNMKKRITVLLVLLALCLSLFAKGTKEEKSKSVKIGVSQLLAHPALDAITEGIIDYLDSTGLDYTIDVQIANGEVSTCAQIAQLFKSNDMDLVIGVATPSAQALANTFSDGKTPVIYATVTDPEAAGLEGLDYVCGTTDQPPLESHFDTIRTLLGSNFKTLGMLYTSIEANGIALMENMKAIAEKNGIEFVPQAVNNSAEVKSATQTIIDRVDAIYEGTDNTVISAINGVAEVGLGKGVPVITADTTSSFDTDVLLSGGFNYYNAGVQTGKMAYKVLKGTSPKDLGMEFVTDEEIYINLDSAEKLGITIPEEMINKATYLIKNGTDIKSK